MPASRFTSLLLVLVCGCATRIDRFGLHPASTPSPPPPDAYAQVREVGLARDRVSWSWDVERRVAVTIDVRNDSTTPLTVDPTAAHLVFENDRDPRKVVVAAIAAGPGAFPDRVRKEPLERLTLRPGESATFWTLFDRQTPDELGTMTMVLPAPPRAPLTFRLNTREQPRWEPIPRPSSRSMTLRLAHEGFGDDVDSLLFGETYWHTQGPVHLGVGFVVGARFDRTGETFVRTSLFGLEGTVTWRPKSWIVGAYAGGRYVAATSGRDETRWLPVLSTGLEVPLGPGATPQMFMRLGYTRTFRLTTPHANAVSLAFDFRVISW